MYRWWVTEMPVVRDPARHADELLELAGANLTAELLQAGRKPKCAVNDGLGGKGRPSQHVRDAEWLLWVDLTCYLRASERRLFSVNPAFRAAGVNSRSGW